MPMQVPLAHGARMIDSPPRPPNDSSEPLIRPCRLLSALVVLALACTSATPDRQVIARAEAPPAEGQATSGARSSASDARDEGAAARPDGSTDTQPADDREHAPDDGPGDDGAASAEEAEERDEEEEAPGPVVLDTEYDDERVGRDQTEQVEAELGLVEDEALTRYVQSIAIRLLRHAPTRPFDYEFKIVDQAVPNAFALPGGKIYVSRGLLALATSEDELAAVIGHEITHAAERHASARLEYSRRLNPFAIGLIRAARIAAYGRDQELDADRGGQIMAARAGYDPRAIATFLRKLDAAERYEIGWARIPSFLSTHPTTPQRSAIANDRASSLSWTHRPAVAGDGPHAYYAKIDGLIVGDDPAGGLFEGENRFVHPDLRFTIRFPQGWDTMNSTQAVRAVSPRRDAQAELTVAGPADREIDEIVDAFVEEDFEGMRVRVHDRREVRIGELPAVRIEGRASSPLGGVSLAMTFVRYGDLVYRLSMLSIADGGSRFRGRARAFAHSFRPLDEEGIYSLLVTRLRVALAREGRDAADALGADPQRPRPGLHGCRERALRVDPGSPPVRRSRSASRSPTCRDRTMRRRARTPRPPMASRTGRRRSGQRAREAPPTRARRAAGRAPRRRPSRARCDGAPDRAADSHPGSAGSGPRPARRASTCRG